MSNESMAAGLSLGGNMLLYKQPELLNHRAHGALGLSKPARPFEFARSARVLPLTLGELPTAQKYFPIVFSSFENPEPLAVVGVSSDDNLFVDDDGNWEPQVYVPAYVRCYPFAVAARPDDQLAVVIDRAADAITDDPQQPFFDGEQVTPQTQNMIDFCGRYDGERKATRAFGERLEELGILAGQQVTRSQSEGATEAVASYVAVDNQKLAALDESTVKELFDVGYLAGVFAHVFSLENWKRLLERDARRMASEPPVTPSG